MFLTKEKLGKIVLYVFGYSFAVVMAWGVLYFILGLIDIFIPVPRIHEWLPVIIVVKTAIYTLVFSMIAVVGYLAVWFTLIALKWVLENILIVVSRLLNLFER